MKKLLLIFVIYCLFAGVESSVMAFEVVVQNNLDTKTVFKIGKLDHQIEEFMGVPLPCATTEVPALSSVKIDRYFSPGVYQIEWWDKKTLKVRLKEFTAENDWPGKLIVSLNIPEITIRIFKP